MSIYTVTDNVSTVKALDVNQYNNLLTGVMTDQAVTIANDVTLSNSGRLKFSTAVSKIVPGATSLSLRNNADSADNLLVSNAGDVTVRARFLMATAIGKIVPGATSLSYRNNADTQDNLLLTDAGLVTLRNALSIPPSS